MLWMKLHLRLDNKLLKKDKAEICCIWLRKVNLIVLKILKENRHSLKLTLQEMLLAN